MRYYKNEDTGEIWSEEEIRQNYEMFREESEYMSRFDSFEDYLDEETSLGRSKQGGLTPIRYEDLYVEQRRSRRKRDDD